MKSYQEFREYVIAYMKKELGEKWEVVTGEVKKVNKTKDGISLKKSGNRKDMEVYPMLYIDNMYKDYIDNEGSVDEILAEAKAVLTTPTGKIEEMIGSPAEYFRDCKIVPQLVYRERNRGLLKSVPYRAVLDLAVIYRFVKVSGGNVLSHIITNQLSEELHLSEEELYKEAKQNLNNTKKIDISILTHMRNIAMGKKSEESDDVYADEGIIVLTTADNLYGSAVMLDTDFMRKVGSKLGGSFYILPSSQEEILAVPECSDAAVKDELLQAVKEVNATVVSEEDYLSDTVYYFDKDTSKIRIA